MRRATEDATRTASTDALATPRSGKWSPLQVLEHLVLSYTATTKGLQRTMENGQPERTARDLRQQLRSFYVLGLGRFPAAIDAPKHTVPRGGLGTDPQRRFNDALVAMDATLTDAERRFGARAKVLVHPVLGPLTAQQWRRFHLVHGRHHVRQIADRLNGHA